VADLDFDEKINKVNLNNLRFTLIRHRSSILAKIIDEKLLFDFHHQGLWKERYWYRNTKHEIGSKTKKIYPFFI